MPIVVLACALLVIATATMHFEVLRALNARLPALHVPDRFKLLVVIIATFLAHAAEIGLYGVTIYVLVNVFEVGALLGPSGASLAGCLYFSAETYTSLGFGDVTPNGPIRLVAGIEALNGLLLIGWSASFTYLSMERFWNSPPSYQASGAPVAGDRSRERQRGPRR
jgi:hypothetical protein